MSPGWPISREHACSHWLRELPFGDTRGCCGPVAHGLAEAAGQLACGGDCSPLLSRWRWSFSAFRHLDVGEVCLRWKSSVESYVSCSCEKGAEHKEWGDGGRNSRNVHVPAFICFLLREVILK